MRALLLVPLLVAGAIAAAQKDARKHPGTQHAANINAYVDELMPNIAQFLVEKGMDPFPLPDDVQTFSKEALGTVWHGELGLFEGSMSGLSRVSRVGDAILDYSQLHFTLNLTLGFSEVDLVYGFECQLMSIGPKGTLYGSVHDLAIFADLGLDLTNVTSPIIWLNDLYFSNAGTLEITIEGVGLDIFDNIIADLVTSLFHDTIINAIEDKARDVIQDALKGISGQDLLTFL